MRGNYSTTEWTVWRRGEDRCAHESAHGTAGNVRLLLLLLLMDGRRELNVKIRQNVAVTRLAWRVPERESIDGHLNYSGFRGRVAEITNTQMTSFLPTLIGFQRACWFRRKPRQFPPPSPGGDRRGLTELSDSRFSLCLFFVIQSLDALNNISSTLQTFKSLIIIMKSNIFVDIRFGREEQENLLKRNNGILKNKRMHW